MSGVVRIILQTTKKTTQTIQPGDIFLCEYGDYGNWCNFVFVSCKEHSKNITEITVHYPNKSDIFNIYEISPIDKITFDVIGKES